MCPNFDVMGKKISGEETSPRCRCVLTIQKHATV